jgi:hypothetical protein
LAAIPAILPILAAINPRGILNSHVNDIRATYRLSRRIEAAHPIPALGRMI